jgi:hypothetical protein
MLLFAGLVVTITLFENEVMGKSSLIYLEEL